MKKRSLYQCFNAKVLGENIYCAKGHRFTSQPSGFVHVFRLLRGCPLEMKVCQDCPDFLECGGPLPKNQRGWIKV